MKTIFVFLILLPTLYAAAARDWSFQEFCKFWNGGGDTYKPRDNYDSMKGDTCSIPFPTATADELSARTYCETEVPYHINEAIPGDTTICKAEATLICDSGWVQMFGRCYKFEQRMMTRDEAVKHCAKEKPTSLIAFMHREALPFRIYDYFTAVSRIWLDASIAITKDLIYNVPDGNLILALEGYEYNGSYPKPGVGPTGKAMTLCEYTSKMTRAESSHLLKRYGEVYHPTVFTSDSAYVRTANSLTRNENDHEADNKYCTKVLAPFVPSGKALSALPTREFLNEVKKMNGHDKALIIRTSAFSKNSDKSKRMKSTCVNEKSQGFHMLISGTTKLSKMEPVSEWRKGEPRGECDAATWSSSIVLSRDGDPGLEAMSDARYAPMYCQSLTHSYAYGDCPAGFTTYERKSLGQRWCHKHIATQLTYADAEAKCVTMGAHVDGFVDEAEFRFLINKVSSHKWAPTWYGAKRKAECIELGTRTNTGFSKDPTSPCARDKVFKWEHDVAPGTLTQIGLYHQQGSWMEPNFANIKEICIQSVQWDKVRGPILNDIDCEATCESFCGMEAPIIQVN